MPAVFETDPAATAIPITFATKATWEAVKGALPAEARQFAEANGFTAKPGKCLILPAPDGAIAQVIFGLDDESTKARDPFRTGALPGLLPAGT
jgi:leucyl aminopeptidase